MSNENQIRRVQEAWLAAIELGEKFAADLATEDEADRQLDIQQKCLEMAAIHDAVDVDELLVKFEMFKAEAMSAYLEFPVLSAEAELLLSLERDIKRLAPQRCVAIAA